MLNDFTLFNKNDTKSETLTIRLTRQQKQRINLMARHRRVTATRLVLDLIGQENDKLIAEGLFDLDDLPF